MARTRIYSVHVRAWSATVDREAVFIREGFSWGAFLFSILWALSHRLWLGALIILALSAAVSLATDLLGVDPLTAGALGFALSLLIGFEANDWWRRSLERRGYVTAALIAAQSRLEAERRFFSRSAEITMDGWTGSMVV
jgi:hypothetical protein